MDTEVKVTELKKSEVLMKFSWERYCAFEDYAYEDKERVGVADFVRDSVADPDPNLYPPDPHVFGPPGSGSGSISQRYGSGSGSCSGSGSFCH